MCIALAERYSNEFLDYSRLQELEKVGGLAALRALVRLPLAAEQPQPLSSGAGESA